MGENVQFLSSLELAEERLLFERENSSAQYVPRHLFIFFYKSFHINRFMGFYGNSADFSELKFVTRHVYINKYFKVNVMI